jgi:hypothetical protein
VMDNQIQRAGLPPYRSALKKSTDLNRSKM